MSTIIPAAPEQLAISAYIERGNPHPEFCTTRVIAWDVIKDSEGQIASHPIVIGDYQDMPSWTVGVLMPDGRVEDVWRGSYPNAEAYKDAIRKESKLEAKLEAQRKESGK